jgi:hypothetical protein
MVEKVAYEIVFEGPEQWSKAVVADLDHLCRDSHAVLVDQLEAYHARRAGDPIQLAPAIRRVLETHYRRTFSHSFSREDWLGVIISKIRAGGPSHPCAPDLADLEACNAATSCEHHGVDRDVAPPAPPDPDEFYIVVRDCLQLIGALPRAGPTPPARAPTLVATVTP